MADGDGRERRAQVRPAGAGSRLIVERADELLGCRQFRQNFIEFAISFAERGLEALESDAQPVAAGGLFRRGG